MQKKRRSTTELEQIVNNRTGAFVKVTAREQGWAAKVLFAPLGYRNRHAPAAQGDAQPLVDKAVRDLNDKYELERWRQPPTAPK